MSVPHASIVDPFAIPVVPRVIVLLAAYNGADCIRKQLVSILEQSDVAVSIVVSDDASNDATLSEVEALGDQRISVIRRATSSGSAARNFLALIAEHASNGFDYVALADQDDIWLPSKLVRATAKLQETGAAGYSSAVTAAWPDGRTTIFKQSPRRTSGDFLFEGGGQGCTYVMTADFYTRVRHHLTANIHFARKLIYHDWAIYALARIWRLRWSLDPESHILYQQHDGNDTGARSSAAGIARRLKLLETGGYRQQMQGVIDLCSATVPRDPTILRWRQLDSRYPHGRRCRKAWFCLRHGRRRRLDSVLTAFAALLGWV